MAISGYNTAEGLTNGAVPTTGNTGGTSGTAASVVTIASGDTITAATAAADHQTLGYRFVVAAAGAGATRLQFPMVESGRLVLSFYVRIDTLPTAVEDLGGIRYASGNMAVLQIGADGKVIVANSAGATIAASKSGVTFPVAIWTRVDLAVAKGTGTTDGTVGYAYYVGESDVATFSWESAAQNTGTADTATGFIGRSTGRTQAHTIDFDTVRWATTASGFLSHYTVPGAPTPTTLFTNTAEGVPVGSVPSPSNTGGASGTAIDSIVLATGDGIVCSNFKPVNGSRGYAFSLAAAGSGSTRLQWAVNTSNRLVFDFYMGEIGTLPTATEDVCGVRNATGNMGVLGIGADGKFIMNNSAGAGITASKSTATVPVGTKMRVCIIVKPGADTATGTLGYAYFLPGSSSPVFSWESATVNSGTTAARLPFLGRSTGRTQANTFYYDSIRGAELTSGFLDPYVAPPSPPIATLGPDILAIEPFTTVQVSALGTTDSDNAIASYALTQTAGDTVTLSGSGPVWTYRAPGNVTGQTISFSVTATDVTGLTSGAATVNHQILPCNETIPTSAGVKTIEITVITS